MPPVPGLIMSEDIPGACACIVPTYAMKAAGRRFRDHRKTTRMSGMFFDFKRCGNLVP